MPSWRGVTGLKARPSPSETTSSWHSEPVSPVRITPGICLPQGLAHPGDRLGPNPPLPQAVVRDDDVGDAPGRLQPPDGLLGIRGDHDLVAPVGQHGLEAQQHDGVVVDHQHADGRTSARRRAAASAPVSTTGRGGPSGSASLNTLPRPGARRLADGRAPARGPARSPGPARGPCGRSRSALPSWWNSLKIWSC